ncbi:MAG: hypothetical protein A4E19_12610 [Nitrospira sp. SG-bin1]|nr:MAG: hypothetical protein A4E19_12610 [Nitrospira sp. SG-bin1]
MPLVDTISHHNLSQDSSYVAHWGLHLHPFENVPDPKFYVPSIQHDMAIERLLYGIHARKGMVLLTGEIGSGKTLLSRTVILKLSRSRYEIALVSNPTIPGNEFLGELLFQLGLDPHGTRAEQLRRLNDQLLANYHKGVDTVVVVDEAQAIEHDRVFEELRLLSNFQLNDRFLITLVLIGQPELRERIDRIPQLAQRVAVQHHIGYLDRAETKSYVLARLAAAGVALPIFSARAISSIYHFTGGVCRLINSLCDLCLHYGRISGAHQIRRSLVEKVANDLLQRRASIGLGVMP